MAKNVENLPAAESVALPVRAYTSVPVAELTNKEGEKFSIVIGLDESLVQQLKEKSLNKNDEELQRNTSDYRRFGEGSYEDWYGKGRIPFAALVGDGALAAVIWFGPDEFPDLKDAAQPDPRQWDTIAFRSYEPYRGKGIMSSFSAFVIEMHDRLSPMRTLWLETNPDNEPGKHLYHKLGFVDVGNRANNGRLVMIRSTQ